MVSSSTTTATTQKQNHNRKRIRTTEQTSAQALLEAAEATLAALTHMRDTTNEQKKKKKKKDFDEPPKPLQMSTTTTTRGLKLPYSEPVEVAHFSKTKSEETFFDARNLKRAKRGPRMPFDLNEGFANFRDRNRLNPHPAPLTPLFESLERSGKASVLLDVDVLSWRGNVTKLLCAPWESREGFRLECELVRRKVEEEEDDDATNSVDGRSPGDSTRAKEGGVQNEAVRRNNANNKNDIKTTKQPATLVLNVLEAEHKLEEAREMLKNNNKDDAQQDENQTKRKKDLARHERMSYWGFAFEEFVTSEKPHTNAVDCRESFCIVTKSKLGENTKLLLGGEVDCWNGENQGLSGYIELKTTRKIDTKKQRSNFEKFKLLKWWAQSFAVGVRQILVGFRDDDGMVQKMQNLETMKLPSYALAADKKNAWRPEMALLFAEKVLTFIRETMEKYPENSRALVEYIPARTRGESKFKVTVVTESDNENKEEKESPSSSSSKRIVIPDFLPKHARELLQISAKELLSRDEEKRKKILASQALPTISFSGQESENSAGGSIDQSHHHASRLHENSSPDFAKSGGVGVIGSGSGGSHRFKNSSQLALNRKQPMVSEHRREKLKRDREKARAQNNARENQLGWIGSSTGAAGTYGDLSGGGGDFANTTIRRSYAFGATSYIEDLGKNDIIYYATGGEGEVLGAPGEHRNRQHLHGNNNTNENASVSYEDPTSSGLHVGIGIDPSAVLMKLKKKKKTNKDVEGVEEEGTLTTTATTTVANTTGT